MTKRSQRRFHLILGLSLILVAVLACNLPTSAPDTPEAVQPEGEIEGEPIEEAPFTPEVTLAGEAVDLATGSVGPGGGSIVVSKPGDPLDGLRIEVPDGAYSEEINFKISYRGITAAELGAETTVSSPMILIDNGGVFADRHVMIAIPVEVGEGDFVMPFYYDEATGELDGILPIGMEGGEVKAVLRHFSDLFVITTPKAVLDRASISTSFAHGVDNWQFVNHGTFPEPGGHCSGQSLTAMLYHQMFQDKGLYGLYDNYNNTFHATPGLDRDDRLGLRLATVAQRVHVWNNSESLQYWWDLQNNYYDEITYYAFAQTMRTTREPQYVSLGETGHGDGHAIIAYKKYKDRFYVSDPNFPEPSANRAIVYNRTSRKFQTYHSGATRDSSDTFFTEIEYLDKYSMLSMAAFNKLWAQFEAGTIGDDIFPKYALVGLNKMEGGQLATTKKINAAYYKVDGELIYLQFVPQDGFSHQTTIYEMDEGGLVEIDEVTDQVIILPMYPGKETVFGFVFKGKVGEDYEWIDARWIHFIRSWDKSWDSGPRCDEAYETPYRWQVSLLEGDLGNLSGTVHFHDCPGGGQVAYHIVGEMPLDGDTVVMSGTKVGGAGDLNENSPATQQFNIQLNAPPIPNFAP
jgi:hypothetical protein